MSKWRIHLTHDGGQGWNIFEGTREEAEQRAAQYIGKPASWNMNKNPHEPNMWDLYRTARVEAVE